MAIFHELTVGITDIFYRQIIVGFKSIWEYPLKVGKLREVKKIFNLNYGRYKF